MPQFMIIRGCVGGTGTNTATVDTSIQGGAGLSCVCNTRLCTKDERFAAQSKADALEHSQHDYELIRAFPGNVLSRCRITCIGHRTEKRLLFHESLGDVCYHNMLVGQQALRCC